jgi:hypothetical protein
MVTRRRGTTLLMMALLLAASIVLSAAGNDELAAIRRAAAPFHRVETAQAAGWDLVPGLDYCFNNPGIGAMGYHYINMALLDTTLDALQPEAMVYAPGPNGQLQLGAVEYIVPADAWDALGMQHPPSVLGHHLHLNPTLGVYVLHVWVFKHNPAGMFEDWNPNVSCRST